VKAIVLRFEPLLVFGVVIALALWELVSLYRRDRRRKKGSPPVGRPVSERAADLEGGA
jgi:hypothetical protein